MKTKKVSEKKIVREVKKGFEDNFAVKDGKDEGNGQPIAA